VFSDRFKQRWSGDGGIESPGRIVGLSLLINDDPDYPLIGDSPPAARPPCIVTAAAADSTR
jgi:hypothetical protein